MGGVDPEDDDSPPAVHFQQLLQQRRGGQPGAAARVEKDERGRERGGAFPLPLAVAAVAVVVVVFVVVIVAFVFLVFSFAVIIIVAFPREHESTQAGEGQLALYHRVLGGVAVGFFVKGRKGKEKGERRKVRAFRSS